MEYDQNNIFARMIQGEIPCDKVYEDENVLAFRDINPQAPVHILLIPKAERCMLSDCSEIDLEMLGRLQLAAVKVAKQENLENFRLVVNNGAEADQTVFHLHVHLLGGRKFTWPPG